jgi:hypothetical protein
MISDVMNTAKRKRLRRMPFLDDLDLDRLRGSDVSLLEVLQDFKTHTRVDLASHSRAGEGQAQSFTARISELRKRCPKVRIECRQIQGTHPRATEYQMFRADRKNGGEP